MSERYDIAVLGACPAGCATASILAAWGLRVALVDLPAAHCESPLCDWVPRDFWRLPGVPPATEKSCGGAPFRVVRYHDSRFARQAQIALRPAGGSLLQYARLTAAMTDSARKAGAKICRLTERPSIRLGEESVLLAGGHPVAARLLLIAQGGPQDTMSDLALPVRPQGRSQFVVAALEAPLPSKRPPKELQATLSLVASRQRGKLGMFFALEDRLHVRLVWSSPPASAAAELSAFFSELQNAGLVGRDLPLREARGAVWRPPAGEALDLETHSAKRCLLLGTAGGFADSITGATLYPSVRSAAIAAKAARAALAAANPQEPLMRYKNEWRKLLADGLRPPRTSVDMFLPLLMSNRRLVGKFTRAMLNGQSI